VPDGDGHWPEPNIGERPWGETEEERKKRPWRPVVPPEVVVPIGVAALATALGVWMLKQAATKNPYVAAALVLIAVGLLASGKAEASPGGGGDLWEALFEDERSKLPKEIRDAIESDPELKRLVQEALQGRDPSEAQKALSEAAAQIIAEHMDEFSQEELAMLITANDLAASEIPSWSVNTQTLHAALETRKAGVAPGGQPGGVAPQGAETGAASGPGVEAGTPGGGATGTGTAGRAPQEGTGGTGTAGFGGESAKRLAESPAPVQRLYKGITGKRGEGVPVTPAVLQRFLEVTAVSPPLSDAEVDRLLSSVGPIEGKTDAQLIESVRAAVESVRAVRGSDGGAPTPAKPPEPPKNFRELMATSRQQRFTEAFFLYDRTKYRNLAPGVTLEAFIAVRAEGTLLGGAGRFDVVVAGPGGAPQLRAAGVVHLFDERGTYIRDLTGGPFGFKEAAVK
jgi:hypothetical protein